MLFNVRLPTIFETLSLLSILSPFAKASTFPNQPNAFKGVTINAAGTLAVACTSNQWFLRAGVSTAAWTLGTASTGLSGMVNVAMNNVGDIITFAGTDGFRAYYGAGVPIVVGTLPTLITTSSSNVNSLAMTPTAAGVQIMGTLDGGLWTSSTSAAGFVKYVRVGPNAGAGENFVPIGAVAVSGTTYGALGVTYTGANGRGYSATTSTDFSVISNLPTGTGALTSMCMTSATLWYATFRSAAAGTTVAVQKSSDVSSSAWAVVQNATVFPTAQHVTSSAAGGVIVVCANDQVFVSADDGATFQVEFPYFDQALQSWSNIMPETPLRAAVSETAGVEIVVITRLSIYSATCSYSSENILCAWVVVSIQTSTATYLSQEGSSISGKNGDIHYSSNNGGLSWNVELQVSDAQKNLL